MYKWSGCKPREMNELCRITDLIRRRITRAGSETIRPDYWFFKTRLVMSVDAVECKTGLVFFLVRIVTKV